MASLSRRDKFMATCLVLEESRSYRTINAAFAAVRWRIARRGAASGIHTTSWRSTVSSNWPSTVNSSTASARRRTRRAIYAWNQKARRFTFATSRSWNCCRESPRLNSRRRCLTELATASNTTALAAIREDDAQQLVYFMCDFLLDGSAVFFLQRQSLLGGP